MAARVLSRTKKLRPLATSAPPCLCPEGLSSSVGILRSERLLLRRLRPERPATLHRMPKAHGHGVPKFGWDSADVRPQPNNGVIRADIGTYRARTVDGEGLLPVITQTRFFCQGDVNLMNRVAPNTFMGKKPAVTVPREGWNSDADTNLIKTDVGGLMLTAAAPPPPHVGWVEGFASSSAGLLRPERPPPLHRLRLERPATLHRMPMCAYLSSSINTLRTAAVPMPRRTHHRGFSTFMVEGHGHGAPQEPSWDSADLLPPPDTGVIRPDIGSYKAQTVDKDGQPRLPVITQTSFFCNGDIRLTNWLTPRSFMDRNPAVSAINLPSDGWPLHSDNPLINKSDLGELMLTESAKVMWQSLLDLVAANRARGYCISRSVNEENLLVSSVTGQFALRRPYVQELPEDPRDFVGFQAVKKLFIELMVQQYGGSVIELLNDAVSHFLHILEDPNEHDGVLATRHPCMMPYAGWAELLIRIFQFLTMEWHICHHGSLQQTGRKVLSPLSELYQDVGSMHPFFEHWLENAEKTAKNTQGLNQQQVLDPQAQRGRQLLAIHRNGLMHSHSWQLHKLAKRRRYTKQHIVELLQLKCSLTLPESVRLCKDHGMLDNLKMDNYHKKNIIYPH